MLGKAGRASAGLAAAALVVAGVAAAATTRAHTVSASLDAKQEVPKQVVKASDGTGSFTGTYVAYRKYASLTWKLTYSHLSGHATAAQIRLGKSGVAGNVLVPLCAGNCYAGITGKSTVTTQVIAEIAAGKTYVNVHTKKNPAGEIRGQVKLKR